MDPLFIRYLVLKNLVFYVTDPVFLVLYLLVVLSRKEVDGVLDVEDHVIVSLVKCELLAVQLEVDLAEGRHPTLFHCLVHAALSVGEKVYFKFFLNEFFIGAHLEKVEYLLLCFLQALTFAAFTCF